MAKNNMRKNLLVVDVGNTSTAIGLWSDGHVSRVAHIDDGFDAAFAVAERLAARVDGMAYVSVVPRLDRRPVGHIRKQGKPCELCGFDKPLPHRLNQ